jgi:hypothetical protein
MFWKYAGKNEVLSSAYHLEPIETPGTYVSMTELTLCANRNDNNLPSQRSGLGP